MWKKIVFYLTLLLTTSSIWAQPTARHLKHLVWLKDKHPYGLIGDDFDILNKDDLTINECDIEPQPFSPKARSFSYWQCFENKNVSILCDHGGVQDPKGEIEAFIVLEVSEAKTSHEYIARRPWSIKSCESFGKNFKALTKNTKHVCISGSLIDNREIDDKGRAHTAWVFDKFKTKKGCDSYFKGECSLRYQIKNGCKI